MKIYEDLNAFHAYYFEFVLYTKTDLMNMIYTRVVSPMNFKVTPSISDIRREVRCGRASRLQLSLYRWQVVIKAVICSSVGFIGQGYIRYRAT